MRAHRLSTHAELMAAASDDPFVRHDIPADFSGPGFAMSSAVVVVRRTHTRRVSLLALGGADALDALLGELRRGGALEELPLQRVTVAHGSLGAVGRHLALADGEDWEWMCTLSEPPRVPGEAELERLGPASRPEIEDLLAQGNPQSDARPFQFEGQRWVGARDEHGALVACGVEEPNVAGFPILSGITVRPDHRGQRLGLAVTAYLTREAVQRRGVCTLSMYSHNDAARRVYTGLGYGDIHQWQSRRLRSTVPGLGEQTE